MSKCIYYFLLSIFLPGVQLFAQLEYIGPEGGYIECMISDNQENILAGTRFGGIYKTTNFGDNWTQIFTGYRNLDVRSLAVNTNNDYFAGTDAGGFFRSTNGGISWEKVNNILTSLTIQVLLITPTNEIFAGTFNGLYKSTDNGTTFTTASNGITTSSISALAYSENFLLAGTYYAGVFKSTDNGSTWQAFNNGLDYNSRIVESIVFSETVNNPAATPVPYVSIGDKFYFYDEPSAGWSGFTDPPKSIKNFRITNIRGASSILGAANTNITTQGGGIISIPVATPSSTWTIEIAPEKSCGSLVETTQGIMAGYYGPGVVGSTDGLNTFQFKNDGLKATNITAMTKSLGDSVITIGTATGQVWVSQNGGYSWENDTYDLPPGSITDITVDEITGTTIVTTFNGVYTKKYSETSWTLTNQISAQSVGVNSQGTALLGYGNHIYVSNDDFQTYTSVYTGAPGVKNIVFDFNDKAYISATDQFNFQSIGVLTADPPLYDNWTQFGTGLENQIITTVNFVDNGTFTSSCTGDFYAGTKDGKLFIFSNGQFNEYSNGIALTNPITSIVSAIVPGDYAPTIEFAQEVVLRYNPNVCSSNQLSFPSDDKIEKLIRLQRDFNSLKNSNAPSKNSSQSLYIYYGTKGTGVIRKDLLSDVEIISTDIPTRYSLSQNYPNPFNPSTTIQFSLPDESFTRLEIFNSLGEKVSTLISESLGAGSYKYEWNAEEFTSGIYFYSLSTGNFRETKKLVLLK